MEQREGYKKTKIGWIPDEWDCVKLGDVALIKGRIGWKGLKKDEYTNDGPYLVAGKHIKSSCINWDLCDHIPEERYIESMEIALKKGDTILTKDGSIGNPAFIDILPGKATINSTMLLIRANSQFFSKFVFYQFQNNNFSRLIREKLSGSSIPHIFQRDMIGYQIPLPPLPEQQKIASILTTVDDKISSIDQQIQQTEQLKKGLMEKLLTEGIGHTEFKDTKIGRIPAIWDIRIIGSICDVKGGKRLPQGEKLVDKDTGYPYIRVADMFMGGIEIEALKYVPVATVSKIKNYIINKEDLFISVAGTLGIVGKVPPVLDGANLTENANKLTNISINKDFLFYILSSDIIQNIIQQEATINALPKLAIQKIKAFLFPLPPFQEQKQIASILSTVDDKIDILQSKKTTYTTLKKGLMQQLLTGQMRVKL